MGEKVWIRLHDAMQNSRILQFLQPITCAEGIYFIPQLVLSIFVYAL